ncbi:CPK2 [Symbiodinium sp. CCMP2592]|nr:CPK2 [Symbiodinium sp. CCMP2592]
MGPMQLDPVSPGASTATGEGAEARDLLDMSPPKRGRTDGNNGVTLEAIRDLLRGELSVAVGQMNERVGTFEQNVQTQLAEATMRIHSISVDTEVNKEKITQVQDRMESIETRLAKLEQGEPAGQEGTRPREPALIMGGFYPDTEAEKVIDQAKQLVDTLRLDLNTQGAFVPGVRRGYCIIPLHKKENESDEDQRARVQSCIKHVRHANVTVGTRQDGTPSKLWLNISQPPEKRRKVQVAAKCKRLLLELGALMHDIDTEYSTGQVWYKSTRVASAVNAGAPALQGWIDLPTISAKIHVDLDRGMGDQFHIPSSIKDPEGNQMLATWNVGGMTPAKVLEFLKAFKGHKSLTLSKPSLSQLTLVLLQEIIVEVGIFFEDDGTWTVVSGKKAGEWRGTAIAFHSLYSHHNATIHPRGSSIVLQRGTKKLGVICAHVRHHATIDETSTILADLQRSEAHKQQKVVLGLDANEVFSQSESAPAFPKGHTDRGETILEWCANSSFKYPAQELHLPSHFPYSGQTPRRLDYLVTRGVPLQEYLLEITETGHTPTTNPSSASSQAKSLAASSTNFGDRDTCAKTLSRNQAMAQKSSTDWRAYRAQKRLAHTREWEHYLLDANCQSHMRDELTKICKRTEWHPFQLAELKITQGRWLRRKAAGPDGVIHEALSVVLTDTKWTHRILYVINDAFLQRYLENGVTVLLPKTGAPEGWPDTRPIIISSAMLKWIAQLVLYRTQHLFDPICNLQWCAKGKQSVEMLLAIRKIARMARDWGGPFFILKIDVKKAFARIWLSLLRAAEMNIQFGGTSVKITQSNGVCQGGPDSPVAFSVLVGDTLLKTQSRVTISAWGPNAKLPPPPHHTSGYLDDVYVWGDNPKHVQQMMDILGKLFAEHGLYVNHKKTSAIANEGSYTFMVGGHAVPTEGPEHALTVLPFWRLLSTRARKAFFANRSALCANTPLASRLKVHSAIVREAALWGAPTWPLHESLLTCANTIQLRRGLGYLELQIDETGLDVGSPELGYSLVEIIFRYCLRALKLSNMGVCEVGSCDRRWADLDSEAEDVLDHYDREESLRLLAVHNFTHDNYDLQRLASKDEASEASTPDILQEVSPTEQEEVSTVSPTGDECVGDEATERDEAVEERQEIPKDASDRGEILKDALALARRLRALAAAEAVPHVRSQACQTDLQAEQVMRLEAARADLSKRRRLEQEGTLAKREAQLEAKRKLVEKARAELAEAQRAQRMQRRKQAQEIANLEDSVRSAEERRSVPLSEEEKELQGLRNELQTLTEENQSMFEAVKWVREEEANAKNEIEAAEADVIHFQDALRDAQEETLAIQRKLALLTKSHQELEALPMRMEKAATVASSVCGQALQRLLLWRGQVHTEEILDRVEGSEMGRRALAHLLGAGCLAAAVVGAVRLRHHLERG